MAKPCIPKGTRDFSVEEMAKRNYIFNTIKHVFGLYGFRQIETPAMETLQTLMGKYGEEGDKLLFKDDFTLARGFQIEPRYLDKQYDLNDDILNPIRFFARLLLHLNNIGWNWQNRDFLDILNNEWYTYGLYRYGVWTNNKFNNP